MLRQNYFHMLSLTMMVMIHSFNSHNRISRGLFDNNKIFLRSHLSLGKTRGLQTRSSLLNHLSLICMLIQSQKRKTKQGAEKNDSQSIRKQRKEGLAILQAHPSKFTQLLSVTCCWWWNVGRWWSWWDVQCVVREKRSGNFQAETSAVTTPR